MNIKLLILNYILYFSFLKVVYIKEEPQCDVTAKSEPVEDPLFINENAAVEYNVKSEHVLEMHSIDKNVEKAFIVYNDVQHNEANNSRLGASLRNESIPNDLVSKCRLEQCLKNV